MDDLASALRRGVDGHLPSMGAVDLLIGHGEWLERLDGDGLVTGSATEGMAFVEWREVGERLNRGGWPVSSSASRMLSLAVSLAGHREVVLADQLLALDRSNIGLVTRAILTATGHR